MLYNLLPKDSWTSTNSVLNVGDSPTNHWYGPANILRFIAAEYNNANAVWLAQQIEAAGIEVGASQWMSVLFTDSTQQPVAPSLDQTLVWFQDMDHIIARTDWSGNEDMLSIKCGIPFGKNLMQLQKEGVYVGSPDAGHAHPDANHITLYANEHQFGVNGKVYTIDVAANTVTVTAGGL